MKRYLEYVWPIFGLVAVVVSLYFLSKEFKGESVASGVFHQLGSISLLDYVLAVLSALLAYAALAWYDRIALLHLGINWISLPFVAVCSFTTYALSHTIGVSVFSGAMVRYRAYSSKGLTAAQVAVLVAICSITFALGVLLLGGAVLVFEPQELRRVAGMLPHVLNNTTIARIIGAGSLVVVAAYVAGSVLRLPPFRVAGFEIFYPKPEIAARQFIAAPLELIGATGIIYFTLARGGKSGLLRRPGDLPRLVLGRAGLERAGRCRCLRPDLHQRAADHPQGQGARGRADVQAVLPAHPARFRDRRRHLVRAS